MKRISRRKKLLSLELSAAVVVLVIACWYIFPFLTRAQSINTRGHFPDPFFRSAVEEFMGVEPGTPFTRDEAAAKTEGLACSGQGISNLTGVEFFTGITELVCKGTRITTLDLSGCTALQRVEIEENPLTSIDLSNNGALASLACYETQLTTLDLSKNPALTWLNCHNTPLERLDITKNTALDFLSIGGLPLETLDVSKNTSLTKLSCGNSGLTSLDVSNNPSLIYLECGFNRLTELDVSNNPALKILQCHKNRLTKLDVSNCPALEMLTCAYNTLAGLNVSGNSGLQLLNSPSNRLKEVDISACTQLTHVHLSDNPFSTLPDFSTLSQLKLVDLRNCDGILSQHDALDALRRRLGEPTFKKDSGRLVSGLAITEPQP